MTQTERAEAYAWHQEVLAPALDGLAMLPALMRALARG